MKKGFPAAAAKLIYAFFAVCFLAVTVKGVAGSYYGYAPLALALLVLCFTGILFLAAVLFRKLGDRLGKVRIVIAIGFPAVLFGIQLVFASMLRYTPVFDVGAVFGGAAEWAETGTFESYYDYFYSFFNNFGGLVFFRAVFGAARALGISDHFMAACAANGLLSAVTVYLTGSCANKLFGLRGMLTAYFMALISLPFLFIAPAFYTDALTMICPIAILRIYLEIRAREKLWQRLLLFALMGIVCALGYEIKATVLIMLIAVVIEALLRGEWKNALMMAGISAAAVFLGAIMISSVVYSHIDRERAEREATPLTHWIMMGLDGVGMYNGTDYDYTRSFEDPEARREAIKERITERVRARGVNGMLSLWLIKADICFNDGTYGLSDCLACPHEEENALHSFLLNEGEYNMAYRHVTTGVLLALYLLAVASCAIDLFRRESPTLPLLAPRLALFGLLLFLMMWEARWRYFSNYIPVIFICALTGLFGAADLVGKKAQK